MQYNWNKWNFYNNLSYAHEYGKIRESSSRIALQQTEYHFSVGHTYKQTLPMIFITMIHANDINFIFGYT